MIVEELKRRLRCAVMYIPITSFVLHLIAERGKKQMQAEYHLQKPYFASVSPVI